MLSGNVPGARLLRNLLTSTPAYKMEPELVFLVNPLGLAETMSRLALFFAVVATTASAYPARRPYLTDMHTVSKRMSKLPVFEPQILATNDSNTQFDVLEHLAGISPYFNSPGVSLDSAPPESCAVSSATYLIRHSNIYANDFDYEDIIEPFTSKLANFTQRSIFSSSSALPQFAFLSTWTSPITNATAQVETLTPSGAQAAAAFGKIARGLYPTLFPASPNASISNVWTSQSERTIASANAFISGAFASNSSAALTIIPEGKDESANSLTPHESCPTFDGSTGSKQSGAFQAVYTAPIIARLNSAFPAFNFTTGDIIAMQELCGYETVIRNSSAFCQAFEQDDWLGFEYANDLMYHYSLGYGLDNAPVLGLPWLRASTTLLLSPLNHSQSVYFSFTHREEPPLVLTALGLFNNTAYSGGDINSTMPSDRINYHRAWKTSEILPFLGHVALERLECSAPSNSSTSYIRALVNGAPIPIPTCQSGLGSSCPVADFDAYVRERTALYGDFVGKCGVNTTTVTNATNELGIYWGRGPGTGQNVTMTLR